MQQRFYKKVLSLVLVLMVSFFGMRLESAAPRVAPAIEYSLQPADGQVSIEEGLQGVENSFSIEWRVDQPNKSYFTAPGWRRPPPNPIESPVQKPMNKIRTRDVFDIANSVGEIIIFVIHGTTLDLTRNHPSGPKNPGYWNSGDVNNGGLYKRIMAFASELAQSKHKSVELLSYEWSGYPTDSSRKKAASYLKKYIDYAYPASNQQLEFAIIAHSHGCNIANMLSRKLGRPIQLLIYFACPNREAETGERGGEAYMRPESLVNRILSTGESIIESSVGVDDSYSPGQFGTLIYFYSVNDWTVKIGAVDKATGIKAVALPVVSTVVTYAATALLTGSVLPAGGGKLLAAAKNAMVVAPTSTVAATTGSASANVINRVCDHANYINYQQDKRMLGVQVQFDGIGPNHTNITNILAVAFQVLMKADNVFPIHTAAYTRYSVNVNGSTIDEQRNSMRLSILEPGDAGRIFNLNPVLQNALINRYRNIAEQGSNDMAIIHAGFRHELDHSQGNESFDVRPASSRCVIM